MGAKKPKPPVDVIVASGSYQVPGSRSVRGKWFIGDVRIISACLGPDAIEPELLVRAIFVHDSVRTSWWWNLDDVVDRLLEQQVAP